MTWKEIADIFRNIELFLIDSLKRNLSKHKEEEDEYGFKWPAWQTEKLRNLNNFLKQNKNIMEHFSPQIDSEVKELMAQQYKEGMRSVDNEVKELNIDIPRHEIKQIPDDQFFGIDKPRIDSLLEDVNNNMHVAQSSSLRLMEDVYRQTIYKAELAAASGAVTMEQAVDMAVKDFLSTGINSIVYRNGRRVNIATYAEMALRTASLRSHLRGQAQRRQELGVDTVLVSQYGACSDTCLPWQGKVYIDDVWAEFKGQVTATHGKSNNGKWYLLLSGAIKKGLFHPNCRHHLSTWIEGISTIPEPLNADEVRKVAELEKRQRALEWQVRKWKRLKEGSLDEGNIKAYNKKISGAQKELRDFINKHSNVLRRDYWREKTHGIENISKSDIIRLESDRKAFAKSQLPKTLELENEVTYTTINVDGITVKGVVPKGAELTGVRTFAGKGVKTNIRDRNQLSKLYGGNPDNWEKKAGIVKTDNFNYDIHWYEINGIKYEEKLKTVKGASKNESKIHR